jgi:uncharacterized protein (DUF1778 family)
MNENNRIQDNKTQTIIARVSPELKNELQKLADMDNRKLGDFIRLQLAKLIEDKKKEN